MSEGSSTAELNPAPPADHERDRQSSGTRWALKLAVAYALLGGLWIVLTSLLLPALVDLEPARLSRWETYKGWLFIGVTAVFLYLLARRSVRAMAETQAKYRALVEESLIGVYIIQDGRFAYVSPRMAEIFRYTPQELIGHVQVLELVAPESRPVVEENFRLRLSGEFHSIHYSFTGLRKDGSLVDVEAIGSRTLYQNRPAIIGSLLDISGRKRAETELRASEQRYRLIFETAPNLISSVDAQGVLVDCNARIKPVLGYDRQDVIGQSIARFIHPQDVPKVLEVLREVMDEGRSVGTEWRMLRKDGSTIEVRANSAAVRDEKGRFLRSICVVDDITEHKRLERELFQSAKMEAIGRLAGGVAHDFNNLLAVIAGYGESLQRRLEPESPLQGHAAEIVRAAERGAALTEQLLAFSRRQTLRPQLLDLNEIVRSLEEMLRRVVARKIRVHIELAQSVSLIRADRGQLEQVIVNLALNARDAMGEDGVLSVRTDDVAIDSAAAIENDLPPGRYVRLTVEDTGCGMDAQVRARIFEPFFTTKEGKGTGLGLSIVFGIVQQAGGAVLVRSEPQCGATFEVLLPCARTEQSVPATIDG